MDLAGQRDKSVPGEFKSEFKRVPDIGLGFASSPLCDPLA